MPGVQFHLDKAEHNTRFLDSINKSIYPDWSVTAMFYIILHLVDAYLANKGLVSIPGHTIRRQNIAKDSILGDRYLGIASSYKFLESESRKARYEQAASSFARPRVQRINQAFHKLVQFFGQRGYKI